MAAPGRWDEACFAVPAIRALQAAGLPLTLLCKAGQEAFWSTLPGLRIATHGPKDGVRSIAARLGGFTGAILWEAGDVADACAKAGIPRRSGPGGDKALDKRLTDPVPPPAPGPIQHRVRHYLALVEAMGLDTRVPAFFEPCDPGVARIAGSVLLAPDSDFGRSHEWPLDRWETVARSLNGPIAVATGAAFPLGTKLAALLGETATPLELPAFPSMLPTLGAFERVIAADGSLPHLASHAGATCTVLFGPNEPAWKRPLGKRHTIARRHVECSPCFAAKCAMDLRCQFELTADQVV